MAFEVACTPAGGERRAGTEVRVTQQGYEESERWRRYYEVIGLGWGARSRRSRRCWRK